MKLKAKIIIIISIFAVIVFGAIAAIFLSQKKDEISITFPENYVVISEDTVSDNVEFIENLGYSNDSFIAFLHEGNVCYFAADESNSMQFTLSAYSTDLSEEIGNLSEFSETSFATLAQKLGLKGYTGVTVKNKEKESFYELFHPSSEREEYVSLQYVTIKNGKYYVLNYYGSQKELGDEEYKTVRNVLDSLQIEDNKGLISSIKEGDALAYFYAILAFLVSVLGVVVIVLLSISIIKDIKKARTQGDSDSFKIKRTRKYR